jgi:hypothetical protein
MSAFTDRCEREDEEDRLVSINAMHDIERQAKALNGPDRLSVAIGLLLDLVDEGVLVGWKISRPEPRG